MGISRSLHCYTNLWYVIRKPAKSQFKADNHTQTGIAYIAVLTIMAKVHRVWLEFPGMTNFQESELSFLIVGHVSGPAGLYSPDRSPESGLSPLVTGPIDSVPPGGQSGCMVVGGGGYLLQN